MARLFQKGILAITKVSNPNGRNVQKIYTMNPFVCRRGSKVDVTTIELFEDAWHPSHMPVMETTSRPLTRADHKFDNKKIIVMPRRNGTNG